MKAILLIVEFSVPDDEHEACVSANAENSLDQLPYKNYKITYLGPNQVNTTLPVASKAEMLAALHPDPAPCTSDTEDALVTIQARLDRLEFWAWGHTPPDHLAPLSIWEDKIKERQS